MMDPRMRAFLRVWMAFAAFLVLIFLFPKPFSFAEGVARSVSRLWWLVLWALGIWLIWGVGRRTK
jgi:predicted membrane protein